MLKRIHTYDCDGVLVDTSHRYRNLSNGTIDLPYWFANRTQANIAKDKLLPLAIQYLKDCLNPETYTILCTSRAYHVWDIEFIIGRLGSPDKLLMRPVDNIEGDAILKRRQLQRLFNLRQFSNLPRRFWEDNQKNIDACNDLFTETFLVKSNQGA
jgi:hypothetical protein